WGYFLNMLYQIVSRFCWLRDYMRMDHRHFFEQMKDNKLVKFKNWDSQNDDDSMPVLSREGAWAIFDSEYYRRITTANPSRKPDQLLRHEGLFDFWNSAGFIFVGLALSFLY